MKKSKLFIVSLIAVLMTVGLVLAGCRITCEGAGTCEIKGGKGSYCSNIGVGYVGITGCAATKAYATDGSGKCDC
jgi:hypothetical protein